MRGGRSSDLAMKRLSLHHTYYYHILYYHILYYHILSLSVIVHIHLVCSSGVLIWCVDLTSGKQIWRKSYKNPFKIGGGGERHGKGPKSCPVMADGRLFTLSITGMIHAWDVESGSLLWRKDYRGKWEKGNQPNWGVSTSPSASRASSSSSSSSSL